MSLFEPGDFPGLKKAPTQEQLDRAEYELSVRMGRATNFGLEGTAAFTPIDEPLGRLSHDEIFTQRWASDRVQMPFGPLVDEPTLLEVENVEVTAYRISPWELQMPRGKSVPGAAKVRVTATTGWNDKDDVPKAVFEALQALLGVLQEDPTGKRITSQRIGDFAETFADEGKGPDHLIDLLLGPWKRPDWGELTG